MPLADHCLEDEKVPSMVTLNINSMSMTTPGGIADRFFKVLCLTLHLTQRFEVVCLQDTRHPSDSFCKAALSPLFPNYTVHASAGTKEAGGVITILSPTVLQRYKVTRSVVSDGTSEIIVLSTQGDREQVQSFEKLEGKGFFTSATIVSSSSSINWPNSRL